MAEESRESAVKPSRLELMGLHRPELRAWALYDWANSAMVTVIVTAVFPVFFHNVAADGMDGDTATGRFTIATAVSLTLVALLAIPLGALADARALRKTMLATAMVVGVVATAAMFWIGTGEWLLALVLFGLANTAAGVSFVFYDSLLPHVAHDEEVDRLSTAGYALGYIGGGLLLALDLLCILRPEWFGLPHGDGLSAAEASLPTRIAFVSVAVWWLLFSIPLLRRVSEPPAEPRAASESARGIVQRLLGTLRELRRFPEAARMLVAFLIYNDGIQTIIRVATIYGATIGLATGDMIAAVLMVQFVGVPFAFLFGRIAGRVGAKRAILAALVVYVGIAMLGYMMQTKVHFYLLGVLVGMCQGGAQALSRSLFSSMIPRRRSAEFFAFFAVGEKFAGIAGPLLFGLFVLAGGESRIAVLLVSIFFVVGGALLRGVDVERGRERARAAEAVQPPPVGASA